MFHIFYWKTNNLLSDSPSIRCLTLRRELPSRFFHESEKKFVNFFLESHIRAGVHFTNILGAAFTRADPINAKMTFKSSVLFFALLGSERVKTAGKTLMKLTPDEEK